MQSPRDLREWQKAVERGIAAAKGGTRQAIAHADRKTDTVKEEFDTFKDLTPAAPVELTYQTSTYIDAYKRRRGTVTADFPDVVYATTGEPINVTRYEIEGQDQGLNPLGPFRALGGASESSILVTDLNPGSTWKFRVRAVGGSLIRAGEWSAETQVQILTDTTPPPAPSTPIVTVSLGAITVKWDGFAAGGAAMPGDFSHVEVAFGMASSPTAVVDTFYAASLTVIGKQAYNAPHYFRFRAFDHSGNASAWSAQASGIPTPLVDVDVILAHIDAAATQITNIGAESIKTGAILSSKLADNSITQAKLQDQIISLAKLDTAANDKITKGVNDAAAAISAAAAADGKAATAQTTATSANTAAGNAQTAANAAKAAAADAIAQAVNVVPEPGFENGGANWSTYSNVTYPAVTGAHGGSAVCRFTQTSAALVQNFSSYKMPVQPGQILRVAAWFRVVGTLPTAGNVKIALQTFNAAGNPNYPQQTQVDAAQMTTNWQQMVGYYTVPADGSVVSVVFRLRQDATTTIGTVVEWDDVEMSDVTTAKTALDNAALAQAKADSAFSEAQTALTNAGLAQTAANGKNANYYGASAPAGTGFTVGDNWFRGTDNKVHKWDGSTWVSIADTAIASAQTSANNAAAAAATADQKAAAAQTAADTAKTKADQGVADALVAFNKADTAQTTADGKNKVTTSLSAPGSTANKAGDVWWQRDASNILIGQWEGLGGTSWSQKTMGNAMFANIDAGKITAGFIDAARIQAGSIAADKVLVGSGMNLMPDPGFLSATMTALRNTNSTMAISISGAGDLAMTNPGTGSYYMRPTGAPQTSTDLNKWIPVRPGEVYVFTAQLVTNAGHSGDLRYTGRDAAGNVVTGFTSAKTFSGSGVVTYESAVPAGCYWILPEIRLAGAAATSWVIRNTMMMRQKATGELIVDGSITALNIAANTLTSASGVFGTMDASVINAGTMNAARFNAGDIRAKFLEAGKITAVDMVTGTITATSGIIGSLDIGKVTTGTMSGSFITAKTLRAEHLKVSDLTNFAPSFAESPDDWALSGGMEIISTSLDPSGARIRAVGNTGTAWAYGPYMAVTPGESLYAAATVYRSGGTTGGVYLRYYWYDKDKNYITYAATSQSSSSASGTKLELTATVPANIAYTRIALPFTAPGAGVEGSYYLVEGRRQTPSVYIADGAVTADKLVANSIYAKHIVVSDTTNLMQDPKLNLGLYDMGNFVFDQSLNAGKGAVKLTGAPAGTTYGPYTGHIPVTEGDWFRFSADVAITNGTAPNFQLRMYWFDKNGTLTNLGVPLENNADKSTSFTGLNGTYQTIQGMIQIPVGAVTVKFRPTWYSQPGGENLFIANYNMSKAMNSSLIVDGSVTADKVVANAITAKHIVIGDFANLALGSDFDDAAKVPWTLHANHFLSTIQKKSGTHSLRLTSSGSSSESFLTADTTSVKEGEEYYVKAWAYIDSSFNGTSGNSKIRVAATPNSYIGAVEFATIPKSGWRLIEGTVTIPAGTTSLRVTIVSDHTAGNAYLDDIQIRRVSEASLIQNLGVEKLTASTASMGTAVIDKLWTDVVRSRKITTDMLVVGRGSNALADPYLTDPETKTYRNTLAGAWGVWSTSGSTGLVTYGASTLTAGSARSFFFDAQAPLYGTDHYIPVEPGQQWLFSGLYTSDVSGPRGTVRLIKRDGSTSYTSAGWTQRDGTANVYDPSGTVRAFERIYTVPSDVTHIMPAMQFEATCTRVFVYGGNTFTNMATASLIVDGAITARNLTVTEEMWAKVIKFKLISGDEIDVNSIVADTAKIGVLRGGVLINDAVTTSILKADAITSKHTITAATIQTSPTSLRGVKITSTGIKAYNNSGSNTFALDGTTGNLVATGTMQTSMSGSRVVMWDRGDGTAAVDLYTDGTGVHGSLYTQPHTGNGLYVTNLMHYTGSPITTTNWTSRVTLFQDETWAIGQRTKAAEVTGNASGEIFFRGRMVRNNSASTETMVVGASTTSNAAQGTYALTYAAPVPNGTRMVLATPDAGSYVSHATQSASASGFSWIWSTASNANVSMRYLAVWTT